MANVNGTKNDYKVDHIYQWDRNHVLEIHGLSLPIAPEVHFAHGRLEDAIVQQATMDASGVIRTTVPNELLEEARPIKAYICLDRGESFRSLYTIIIPVVGRSRPGPYEEETNG